MALLKLVDEMPAIVVADRASDCDKLRDEVQAMDPKLLVPHKSNRKRPPRDQEHIGRHYKERWRVEPRLANPLNYGTWVNLAVSLIYVAMNLRLFERLRRCLTGRRSTAEGTEPAAARVDGVSTAVHRAVFHEDVDSGSAVVGDRRGSGASRPHTHDDHVPHGPSAPMRTC